jgi:hypothetical protein
MSLSTVKHSRFVSVVVDDERASGEESGEENIERRERRAASFRDPSKDQDASAGNAQNQRPPLPEQLSESKKEICEALRNLVNNDPSDEAFDRFKKDKAHAEAFVGWKLRGPNRGNIFHRLVPACKEWDLEDIFRVLTRLLKKPSVRETANSTKSLHGLWELLEEDSGDGTPIFQALTSGNQTYNPRFVEGILMLDPPPPNLGKVLWKQSLHSTMPYCLHAALSAAHDWNFSHIHKIISLTQTYKPPQPHKPSQTGRKSNQPKTTSPFEAKGRHGNTALHIAIQRAPIDEKLTPPAEAHEPQSDEVRSAQELIKALIDANPNALGIRNSTDGRPEPQARTPYQERIFQLALVFKKLQPTAGKNGGATPNTSGNVEEDDEQGEEGHDPRGEDRLLVRKYSSSDEFREFVIKDPVASYISYYCITKLDRDKAMRYLYSSGEG